MQRKYNILKKSISDNKQYCKGLWSGSSDAYILGTQLATAKTKINFSHPGSSVLDEIAAFDLAEVSGANLGQINMIKVSSFCGPEGLLWGYDICPIKKRRFTWSARIRGKKIPILDLDNLSLALKKLFGTVELPRFPIFPGSHVPCATERIIKRGPKRLYAAEGIGIPEDRNRDACILMEDAGEIPLVILNIDNYKKNLLINLVKSVITISQNQKILLKEIFIGLKDIAVGEDEIGCALVISPYFKLARAAIPEKHNLLEINLNTWENIIKDNFFYNYVNA